MKDPPRKEEQVSLYCDEELKENIRYLFTISSTLIKYPKIGKLIYLIMHTVHTHTIFIFKNLYVQWKFTWICKFICMFLERISMIMWIDSPNVL